MSGKCIKLRQCTAAFRNHTGAACDESCLLLQVVVAMKAGGLAGVDTRTIITKDHGAAAGAEADTTGAVSVQ